MIEVIRLGAILCSGSAGAASGSGKTAAPVSGRLIAVHLDYSASSAATTDVTVATSNAPVVTLLTISNNVTDGWYYPRHQVHGSTGTLLTMDGTRLLVEAVGVQDYITISVAQNDDAQTVTPTLVLER